MMDLRSMQMLHDLKMPIQLIYSCVQLLEMEVGRSARAQDYLRMLTQSADQMEAMVRMAFADESSGGGRCDAVAIARSARDRAALIAPALELRFQTNAAEFPLNANGELITRVLDNLLENAIRFTPAGGRIRVEVKALGDSVELSVIDGGPGMDAAYQSHIFPAFVTVRGRWAARSPWILRPAAAAALRCAFRRTAAAAAYRIDDCSSCKAPEALKA